MRLLKEDAVVYKQVGPTLIRQEPEEAKENVGKRIEFIRKEMS